MRPRANTTSRATVEDTSSPLEPLLILGLPGRQQPELADVHAERKPVVARNPTIVEPNGQLVYAESPHTHDKIRDERLEDLRGSRIIDARPFTIQKIIHRHGTP